MLDFSSAVSHLQLLAGAGGARGGKERGQTDGAGRTVLPAPVIVWSCTLWVSRKGPQQKYSSAGIVLNIVGNSEWRGGKVLPFPPEPEC